MGENAMREMGPDTFSDKYWATVEPEEMVDVLEEKERKYRESLRRSTLWNRVRRNIAYLHGIFWDKTDDALDMELKLIGENDEYLGLAANHMRSLLEHQMHIAFRDKIGLKARAVNSDNKSLQQARIGTNILDYYNREKRVEAIRRTAGWDSITFAQGFVKCEWDPSMGIEVGAGAYEGDAHFSNPTIMDVSWDIAHPWEDKQWVIIKEYKNRWDLAARFPEAKEDILQIREEEGERLRIYKGLAELTDDDLIPVYKFYHIKSDAVPTGRYFCYVKGKMLIDVQMPYRGIPLRRITAGEWIGQGTGWTNAFSLQGLQEMLNGELSSIASNHAALGVQDVWVPRGAETMKQYKMKGGLRLLSSSAKPEPLNLLSSQAELHKFSEVLVQQMQLVAGITGATRGIAESGVTAGNALALLDAKSLQANSGFSDAAVQLAEDVGTDLLRMLRDFSTTQRVITVMGKANKPYQQYFTGDDLELIDRAVVESVNALSKTDAGRVLISENLIKMGAIKSAEQYNTVLETGNLEPLFEAENAQLNIIREENEALLEGRPVSAIAKVDNHVLHIKEHGVLLGTQANRSDPQIVAYTLAHIMEHQTALQDPYVQQIMQAYGYPVPPMFQMGLPPQGGAPPQSQDGNIPPGAGTAGGPNNAGTPPNPATAPPGQVGPGPAIKQPAPAKPPVGTTIPTQ